MTDPATTPSQQTPPAAPDWAAVRRLVDRFMDGETTPTEERRLYAAFARADVPADLQKWAPMMAGFEALAVPPELAAPAQPQRRAPRRLWRQAVGAAAMLAVAVSVGWGIDRYREQRFVATYAGSYVIEDGRKITNLRDLRHDIEQTQRQAQRIESRLQTTAHIERELLRQVSDPQARRVIRQSFE